jgi:predicted RNA binding protein YcfA (HicA-like mRNA interferase family)
VPSKYPILKPKEIIEFLDTYGFMYISQKGSHRKYSDGQHIVIIPMHDEIARGTLNSNNTFICMNVQSVLLWSIGYNDCYRYAQ